MVYLKRFFVLLALALMGACASNKHHVTHLASKVDIDSTTSFYIQVEDQKLGFVYEPSASEDDSRMGPMMYSADAGIAGVLLQVAAHAAIVNSISDNGTQLTVDTRIHPKVKKALGELGVGPLLEEATSQNKFSLYEEGEVPVLLDNSLVIGIKPLFYVSESYDEMRLQSAISFYQTDDLETPVYSNMIEVVDHSNLDPDLNDAELKDRMQKFMGSMLRETIELAVFDSQNMLIKLTPAKTYAYLANNDRQYSRAYYTSGACDRYVLKNLRNWVISIPAASMLKPQPSAACISAL